MTRVVKVQPKTPEVQITVSAEVAKKLVGMTYSVADDDIDNLHHELISVLDDVYDGDDWNAPDLVAESTAYEGEEVFVDSLVLRYAA